MTEGFDSEVQRLVREKNGDTVTKKLFWDIVVALSEDVKRVDANGLLRHKEAYGLLEEHVRCDAERSAQLARDLVKREKEQAKICAEEHELLMKRMTSEPHRSGDLLGSDYSEERDEEMGDIRRAWRFIRWFVAAGVLLVLDIAARYIADAIDKVP